VPTRHVTRGPALEFRCKALGEESQGEGINVGTGALHAAEGTIEPFVTKPELLACDLFHEGRWTNESDGWYEATLKPLTILGEELGCSILFHGDELHSIQLMSNDPIFGTSWDDHSWEKEKARKERHEEWLERTVGDRRNFSWGRIWSDVDTKAGFASISINYHRLNIPSRRA
jgi:hypothetical protein